MSNTKAFSKHLQFNTIDRSSWSGVVDAFEDRITGWLFDPIDRLTEHDAFLALFAVGAAVNSIEGFLKLRPYTVLEVACELSHDESKKILNGILDFYLWGAFDDVSISGLDGELRVYQNDEMIFDPWQLANQLRQWFKITCDDMRANELSRNSCALRVSMSDIGIRVSEVYNVN